MIEEKNEGPDMNKLQAEIMKLEADGDRSVMDDCFLKLLYKKDRELGPDPSEEEAEEAIAQAEAELMQHMRSRKQAAMGTDEWDEDMEESAAVIRRVFRDLGCPYRGYVHQRGIYAFEFSLMDDYKKLQMKVYLEADLRVCRIDAVYPFQAEPEFVYPLCVKLAAENQKSRYGALQYNPSDNKISHRYSFSVKHGLCEDDFRTAFMSVVISANACYDVLKEYAAGRFQQSDRDEIICKARKLIMELDP